MPQLSGKNYYDVLRVDRNATNKQIEDAWKAILLRYEKNAPNHDLTQLTDKQPSFLNAAYNGYLILTDAYAPGDRESHDEDIDAGRSDVVPDGRFDPNVLAPKTQKSRKYAADFEGGGPVVHQEKVLPDFPLPFSPMHYDHARELERIQWRRIWKGKDGFKSIAELPELCLFSARIWVYKRFDETRHRKPLLAWVFSNPTRRLIALGVAFWLIMTCIIYVSSYRHVINNFLQHGFTATPSLTPRPLPDQPGKCVYGEGTSAPHVVGNCP
jgi:hypothetical protein